MSILSTLCICLYVTHVCEAYRALLVFPTPGRSHAFLADGIIRQLLEAGHEVTCITAFPKDLVQHPSLRKIDISSMYMTSAALTEDMFSIDKIMKNKVDLQGLSSLIPIFHLLEVGCLEHESVRNLLNDPNEQFDVVILEWMFVELISGIAAVFNCPYIWLSTVDPHWMVFELIDGIPNPAYTTSITSNNAVPLAFFQRVEELLQMVFGLSLKYLYSDHKAYDRILAPIIRKRGHTVPDFEDVRYNASLMLGNSHVSLGQATSLPQSYKAVGGFHIDPNTDPLPEDLKNLLDNAKHGLIYFSLGTLAKSKYMPVEMKASLLKMFGKLKQTVLWKFEEDLPNRPSNVHIVEWAPQQSILAHPNCVFFITHGGLLSTTEAIHFGKPIIGIPVFGDQFNNVDRFVKRGIAKRVDLSYKMADDLEKAINDMLADSSYSTNVKRLSYIYHHRPASPAKEVVHWIDHVISTGGASHLRSPALLLPWYQKCYLDLTILCIIILCTTALVTKRVVIKSFLKKHQKKKVY